MFELSWYKDSYDKHWGVIVQSPSYVTHKAQRDVYPRDRAQNTPSPQHSSFEQTKFVSLGQCWILGPFQTWHISFQLSRCLFHGYCIYTTPRSFKATNEQYVLWQPFVAWGHCLGTHFIQNLTQNIVLTFIWPAIVYNLCWQKMERIYFYCIMFSGPKCADKVVRGSDGGSGLNWRQSYGDSDQVQELRQDQLQLHQLRPAVLRRAAAGARHGDGQLSQARGPRREGRFTGGETTVNIRGKILIFAEYLTYFVTCDTWLRHTRHSRELRVSSCHIMMSCKHCHKQFINMSTTNNKQRGTPYTSLRWPPRWKIFTDDCPKQLHRPVQLVLTEWDSPLTTVYEGVMLHSGGVASLWCLMNCAGYKVFICPMPKLPWDKIHQQPTLYILKRQIVDT